MTKTRSVTLGCSLQSESGISHPMTSATYCPHRRARNGHCQQRGASGMGHAGGGSSLRTSPLFPAYRRPDLAVEAGRWHLLGPFMTELTLTQGPSTTTQHLGRDGVPTYLGTHIPNLPVKHQAVPPHRQQKAYDAGDPRDFRTSTKVSGRVWCQSGSRQNSKFHTSNAELPASPHGPTPA